MKIIKLLARTAFAFLAITYTVCLINGITVIEYVATDDGGILSVAGRAIEIGDGIADVFWETYTKAETQAAEWLPTKIKTAVDRLSELINGS